MTRLKKQFACHDCGFIWTMPEWNKVKLPYCPECGDRLNVKRYPEDGRPRTTDIKRKRWTPDDVATLVRLFNSSRNFTYEDIAQRMGRTKDSIAQKLTLLRNKKK